MIRVMHLPATGSRAFQACGSNRLAVYSLRSCGSQSQATSSCYCTPVIKEQSSHDNMDVAVSCDSLLECAFVMWWHSEIWLVLPTSSQSDFFGKQACLVAASVLCSLQMFWRQYWGWYRALAIHVTKHLCMARKYCAQWQLNRSRCLTHDLCAVFTGFTQRDTALCNS